MSLCSNALPGGVGVVAQGGADPADLVGGDGGAHAAAANHYATLCPASVQCLTHRRSEVGEIVGRIKGVGAHVQTSWPAARNQGMICDFSSSPAWSAPMASFICNVFLHAQVMGQPICVKNNYLVLCCQCLVLLGISIEGIPVVLSWPRETVKWFAFSMLKTRRVRQPRGIGQPGTAAGDRPSKCAHWGYGLQGNVRWYLSPLGLR